MRERGDFLKLNIDLPSVQVELRTTNPVPALAEIRKIIEGMQIGDEVIYEEFVTEELKMVFSESFLQNKKVMDAIRTLLKQEEDYRVAATEVKGKTAIDLDSKQRYVEVERKDVKRAVAGMVGFDSGSVRQGIVHINGSLDRDMRMMIVDYIHKHMPTAQLRAFHSPAETERVVVEGIFFGDFPEEE